MKDYLLGLDVWEGSLDIDEQVLLDAGVSFLIVRLNGLEAGALRPDRNFRAQWEQAERFLRFPYFVYSPWKTGRENYEFLAEHAPSECRRVAVDIELRRPGYPPAVYAAEARAFLNLAKTQFRPVIYTGRWFLEALSSWPSDVDYWWARYPYLLYPSASESISWEEIRRRLDLLIWSPGRAPGPARIWQCSADRFKPPGCRDRAVDLNVSLMTHQEMADWIGEGAPPRRWETAITAWARSMGYTGPEPE